MDDNAARTFDANNTNAGNTDQNSIDADSIDQNNIDQNSIDENSIDENSIDADNADEDLPPPPSEPTPRYGVAALAMFVFLVTLGYIAAALSVGWVNDHPIRLIAFSARMRNLLGALGAGVPFPVYFVVGGVRLAIAYVTCHLIGRAYGERIYYVFGRYLGATKDQIDQVNSMFDKVEWLVVPWFVGSNLIAAVTGVRRMDWRRLAILTGIGIAVRLILLWVMSLLFKRQLEIVLDWIARYQRPLLLASIALAVLTVGFNLRKGKNFQM